MKKKAAEPSMDEILASIRKMVAEEPAPGSAPVAPQSAAMAPIDTQRTRDSLDRDIADLMGVGDEPAPAAPASQAGSGTPSDGNGAKSSGWFFNRSATPAAPAPSGVGRLSETLELARANIRRATAAAGSSSLFRGKAEPPKETPEATRDLGAVVPGRYEEVSREAAAAQPVPRAALAPPAASKPFTTRPASAAEKSQPAGAPVGTPQWARNLTTADPAGGNGRSGPAAMRTLEDTVADLLRPMLRDWLDANMPRIMEKAMRDASGPKSSS